MRVAEDLAFLPPDHGLSWPDYLRPSREPAPRALQRPNLAGRSAAHVVAAANDMVGRPSPCPENRVVEAPMSCASIPNELGTPLAERVAAALLRRLHPRTGLHRKQLCAALNISRNTLDGWLSGRHPPTSENLFSLIDLFDAGFCREISGGVIAKTPDRHIADKLAALEKLTREVSGAIGGTP